MASNEYKIRRILDEEPSTGRGNFTLKYLVDWEPSLLDARNVSKDAKECYKFGIVVQGPAEIQDDGKSATDFSKMDWIIFKVEKSNPKNVAVLKIDYERLKKEYPQELINYFERQSSV